eukprot:m.307717 g.307717  ORF g.307717 m.307717 type:complete len:75 (-) comp16463_c2_seq3:914-1138(-)
MKRNLIIENSDNVYKTILLREMKTEEHKSTREHTSVFRCYLVSAGQKITPHSLSGTTDNRQVKVLIFCSKKKKN